MRAKLYTSKQVTALLTAFDNLLEAQKHVPDDLADEIDITLDELEASFNEIEFGKLEVE